MGAVAGFGRWAKAQGRAGQIDAAQLFRPEPVIGHVAEPAKGPDALDPGDAPAGFLHHFAMKRGDRVFARINPAARQLEFGVRLGLMGQQDVVAPQQDGIDAGPPAIALPLFHRLAKASNHPCPLGAAVALTI